MCYYGSGWWPSGETVKTKFCPSFAHLLIMHNKVQTSELVKNSFSCIMMLTMNTIPFDLGAGMAGVAIRDTCRNHGLWVADL